MKTIHLKDHQFVKGGAYGGYFKINSKQGVKDVYSLRLAQKEFNILKKINSVYDWTPKVYEVVKIKRLEDEILEDSYGILMEHIKGRMLSTYDDCGAIYAKGCRIAHERFKQLLKIGIYNDDMHDDNIILKKTSKGHKVYVIDFSPECISRISKKERRKMKHGCPCWVCEHRSYLL